MKQEFIDAYYATRENKRRSGDSVDFEICWEMNVMRTENSIEDHTFQSTAFFFITHKINNSAPRQVSGCVIDQRLVDHYIDLRLRPSIERRLTNRTYNNRVGYGPNEAVRTLIAEIRRATNNWTRDDVWLIGLDISGYFPNANQDIAYQQLSSLAAEDFAGAPDYDTLQYMILRSVYSYATHHCYWKSPPHMRKEINPDKDIFTKEEGIGAVIGRLMWQNGMNYYLNDVDHWAIDEMGLIYLRFVDDIFIITHNKEACLAYVIPELRRRLAEKGCTLHPRKFYCQHWTKGGSFISHPFKRNRVYVNDRTVYTALCTVKYKFPNASLQRLESFIQSANSHLGIFKTRCGYNIALRYISQVNPDWWQWCKFNPDRCCIEALPGYGHLDRLERLTHFRFKRKKGKLIQN